MKLDRRARRPGAPRNAARRSPGPEPLGTPFGLSGVGRRPKPDLGDGSEAWGGDVGESLLLFADM